VSDLDLDRLTEDDSLSGRLSTSTTSSQQSRSLETLVDLPTEGRKLQHQTRVRPRPHRNNRQPPTKLNNIQPGERTEENGAATNLDEGLENFYNRKVVPDSAETQQTAGPISDSPAAAGSKKRKPRRKGLFRFMRARSAREDPGGDPEGRPVSRGSEGEQEAPDRSGA
uniref:capping protein, Arp2/3 and myosin-I linker protein 3-like n=1 Tax=Pristiophorus japonicus TaxID=55135 RepID=UPI00398F6097